MKKQYIFLIMILIILYILYLILSFTYKEYKINSHIEYISNINKEVKEYNKKAEKIINYKSSKAYRNKILKEQQFYKNKWETVIFLTTQKRYNKYTTIKTPQIEENIEKESNSDSVLDNMTIYEKWIYLILKKEVKL